MDITFTVETTNGKLWTATCADPVLSVEGNDIVSVSKSMAASIEKWFIETFNTTKRVMVEVPTIKAKIKATVSVRSEKPLTEFEPSEPEKIIRTPPRPPQPQLPEKTINGPCAYLSDGKGVLPVGLCEACSDDPSDTPGLVIDSDGVCLGEYEKCRYYKAGGMRVTDINEQDSYESEDPDSEPW